VSTSNEGAWASRNRKPLLLFRSPLQGLALVRSEELLKKPTLNPSFERYIGIDYSGAQTPASSLKGLRVYESAGIVEHPGHHHRRQAGQMFLISRRPSSVFLDPFGFGIAAAHRTNVCDAFPASAA
jgi:hypothetical protein